MTADAPHNRGYMSLPADVQAEAEQAAAGEMCIFAVMSDSRGLERCVVPPRHEGLHRTAAGREWTDPADNPGDYDESECPF